MWGDGEMGIFNRNKSQAPVQAPVQPQRRTQVQRGKEGTTQHNRHGSTVGRKTTQAPEQRRIQKTAQVGTQVNKSICEITKIPSEFFWKGVVQTDLAFIRILSQKERRVRGYGQPDVEVRSALSGVYYIFRSEINKVCLDTDGKPLRANRLHSDKVYQVQLKINPTRIAYLPPGSARRSKQTQYTLNGDTLPTGRYLIFLADGGGNVVFDRVYKLSKGYFNRMVQPLDNARTVARRIRLWKSQEGMTKQEKYLQASYRIVAKIEDVTTYTVTGFVLSFIKDGKMCEEAFAIPVVEGLVKQNMVRNMTQNFMLTYGSIRDLPTMFIDSLAMKRQENGQNGGKNKR